MIRESKSSIGLATLASGMQTYSATPDDQSFYKGSQASSLRLWDCQACSVKEFDCQQQQPEPLYTTNDYGGQA